MTLEELAEAEVPRIRRSIDFYTGEESSHILIPTVEAWCDLMSDLLRDVEWGPDEYVFFDGKAIPAREGPVRFKGLFRSHDLPHLPHLAALTDGRAEDLLHDHDYWFAEQPDDDERVFY